MLKKANTVITPFFTKTLDIIYPPQCLSCRVLVGAKGNLCPTCWENIQFIADPQCDSCGVPFELDSGRNILCGQCIAKPPSYAKARAVFRYDDASRDLITGFKYSDKIYSSDDFARWMIRVGKEIIESSDLIIPVPLHRIRLFTRRYNQAALLAYSIAKHCGLPVYTNMLLRKKHTAPQASLTFKQRLINVRGAFVVNQKYIDTIADKNIILIDDVMTTGATIETCAKVLVKAGAASVNILTMARTVKG
jgi:ComF family protein